MPALTKKPRRGSPSARDAGGVGPVGLADDAHFVTVRVEYAADDSHAKARMVHVGITADIDEVALVPAARIHVGAADGEELIAARAPGTGGRCRGMSGVAALARLTTALLLLAAAGPACRAGCSERPGAFLPRFLPVVSMLHVIVTSLFGTALKRLVEYMGWRIGVSVRVSAPRPLFVSRLCICALRSRLARTPCCQWVTV